MPVPAPVTIAWRRSAAHQIGAICGISLPSALAWAFPHSIDSTCAEYGPRVGRSLTGRQYAQADGRPGWWTKARPARRTSGPDPFQSTDDGSQSSAVVADSVQRATFSIWTGLTAADRPTTVPIAPRLEHRRLMVSRSAVALAAVSGESGRWSPPRCFFVRARIPFAGAGEKISANCRKRGSRRLTLEATVAIFPIAPSTEHPRLRVSRKAIASAAVVRKS